MLQSLNAGHQSHELIVPPPTNNDACYRASILATNHVSSLFPRQPIIMPVAEPLLLAVATPHAGQHRVRNLSVQEGAAEEKHSRVGARTSGKWRTAGRLLPVKKAWLDRKLE